MMTSKIEQIRTLNDRLCQNLSTGIETAVVTTGVAALGDEAVGRIVKTIAVYDDFCDANDPCEEDDFGVAVTPWRVAIGTKAYGLNGRLSTNRAAARKSAEDNPAVRRNCRHLGQFHLTGSDRYPRFRVSNFAQSPSIER